VLKRNNFTTKKLYTTIPEKNNDVTKAKRLEYIMFAQDSFTPDNTIYMDETPWSRTIQSSYGRSKKGIKAVRKQPVIKDRNISLIAAISPVHGLVYYDTHEKQARGSGVTSDTINEFITNMLKQSFFQQHTTPFYIIMDNARIHNAEGIQQRISTRQSRRSQSCTHAVKFLPPYSPFLNPIEACFNVWKQHAHRNVMWDRQALKNEIDEQSILITSSLTMREYDHTLKCYPSIAELKDME
jgi:transposase